MSKSSVKPAAAKPVRGVVRLYVEINDEMYRACPLPVPGDGDPAKLYSVRKLESGDVYHVSQHKAECRCTCPDYVYRCDGKDPKGCKPVAGLVAAGLIANPAVRD